MESDRYERVFAAVRREVPDRVPWTLWGHIPAFPFLRHYSWEKSLRDGEELARAHIALLQELDYKMDLLKVTCYWSFMASYWGSKYQFTDNHEKAKKVNTAVKKTEDWEKLWVLDPKNELKEHIRAVRVLSREIGRTMPFVYSIPSPFAQVLDQVSSPEQVYSDMESHPEALKEGLETITQTCIDFGKACIDEGATGIFYGTPKRNSWARLTRKQLEEFMLYYDKKVLNALKDAPIMWLHICSTIDGQYDQPGEDPQHALAGGLMEEGWFKKYPVNAINWWDHTFTPLPVARKIYGDTFCLIGGIDQWNTMMYGTPKQVEDYVKASIESNDGAGGWILGGGCTVKQHTPDVSARLLPNFNAVGRTVQKYGRYRD